METLFGIVDSIPYFPDIRLARSQDWEHLGGSRSKNTLPISGGFICEKGKKSELDKQGISAFPLSLSLSLSLSWLLS